MRLLMTADPIGGVWNYAIDLVAGLRPHGVEVVLATMGAPVSSAQRRQLQRYDHALLAESRFKLEWMPDPWNDVARAGDWLQQLARDHRVDVVHHNHLAHGALPYGVPVLTVAHSCVLSWWQGVKETDAPAWFDHYRAQVRRSLTQSRAVVTISHAMARALQRHYGPLPDVSVVHNARRLRAVRTAQKEPLVFTAGRVWDAAKNVAAVVRAAPQLPWPVVVAGPPRAPAAVTDADDEVADTDRSAVRFTGRLAARGMAGWYRRAAIYALPARYEPFGLTVLEAAHAGCALVLGDIPSLRELWQGAALFVPPNDDQALVHALRALMSDPSQLRARAAAAQARAATFAFDRFVHRYLGTYHTLAPGTPSLAGRGNGRSVPARAAVGGEAVPRAVRG